MIETSANNVGSGTDFNDQNSDVSGNETFPQCSISIFYTFTLPGNECFCSRFFFFF